MSFIVPQPIENYAAARSQGFGPLHAQLAAETHARTEAPMMLSGELGAGVLRMVAQLIGARRVLEVGMFTGFGTLALAEGTAEGGEVHTIEFEADYVKLAKPFLDASPHSEKIHVHLGSAPEILAGLEGPFDLVFIDADKTGYKHYYEEALRLLRPGGVVIVDNALWSGRVLDPQDPSSAAIDDLNRHIENDERVDRLLLTVRDGMFLARKR